jgi:hypothetical protein
VYYRFYPEKGLPDYQKETVLELIQKAGIEVLDFETTMHTLPDPLSLYVFRAPRHFTEQGYALFGETIVSKLKEIESRRSR